MYRDTVIPAWQGQSIRDLLFREMTPEWLAAYEAGIFTEFMEQRAPGHTVLDDKIYRKGMLDFVADIDASLARLDFLHDMGAYDKQEELRAMRIAATALIRFAQRTQSWRGRPRPRRATSCAAGAPAHRGGLRARARTRPARLLGGPAVLLVRPLGRHH